MKGKGGVFMHRCLVVWDGGADLVDDVLQGVHLLVQFPDLLLFRWLVRRHIVVDVGSVVFLGTVRF